jgi:hypothetical protein
MMTVRQTFKPVTYYDPEARRYLTRYEPGLAISFDDEPEQEETVSNESYICPNCNGSGEGMYEGTRCWHCKGTGEEPREEE